MNIEIFKKSLRLITMVLFLEGCAAASGVHELLPAADMVTRTPTNPENVVFFNKSNPPIKSVVLIANVAAHGNGYANDKTLEASLKKEAAELGAELVILTDKNVTKDETIGSYSGGMYMSSQIQRPHLYGVAAVYSKVRLGVVLEDDGTVKYIPSGTPAERAGIQEGMKILSINGKYFSSTAVLQSEVSTKSPGDVIIVEYLDLENKKQKASITLVSNEA